MADKSLYEIISLTFGRARIVRVHEDVWWSVEEGW